MTVVREFHQAFGAPISDKPTVPCDEQIKLRIELIAEELKELAEACGYAMHIKLYRESVDVDLVEAADALGDLRYVIDGANLVFGFPQEEILNEIHRSNMSKLGADGYPVYREDGKILKGPNYFRPKLAPILGLESNSSDTKGG